VTIQLTPRDIAAADQLAAAQAVAPVRRRWSTRWVLAAAVLTVVVDVSVVWGVVSLFGPIGLLTCAVLAVGGLYVVATRPSTTSLSS
jgi:hypothetical protein